jgi:hypothetical protein
MRYIDKSALVAEIWKRRNKHFDFGGSPSSEYCHEDDEILGIIDTLEVKEVDLDKELNDFIEEQKAWVKDDRVVEYNNGDSFNHIYDLEPVAKHFFELGLKTQKGE